MAPPGPPRAVERRRAASRVVSSVPMTFTSTTRRIRARSMSARREPGATMPALATTWVTGPSAAAARSKRAVTSSSRVTSPRIATARPDAAAVASGSGGVGAIVDGDGPPRRAGQAADGRPYRPASPR